MTKQGAARLAASFLTSRRVEEVAADYLDWIDEQDVEAAAVDALMGTARSSKNPARVLANAAALYAELEELDDYDPDPVE